MMGDFPRAEGPRACAEVRDLAYGYDVVLDLREVTNLPAPGIGEALAEEMPGLRPGLRVAFLARADTAFYGVVRQIVTLPRGDFSYSRTATPRLPRSRMSTNRTIRWLKLSSRHVNDLDALEDDNRGFVMQRHTRSDRRVAR